MDTFSLCLGIGSLNISKNKILLFSIIVGILHFIMPLAGASLGNNIAILLQLKSKLLLGIVLIFLAIKSLIDIFKDSPNIYNISLYGLLILAISVSIDSFSTGLGLRAITNNYILASSIFSVFSCLFSILGYIIGSYFGKKCGSYASLIGSFLLLVLGIANLFK